MNKTYIIKIENVDPVDENLEISLTFKKNCDNI